MVKGHCWGYGSRQRLMLAVLAAAPLLGAVPAPSFAADAAQPIVASLNPPPAGLNCTDAAAATSVYFQFASPPFQVDQISLYLDGAGVPQDSVSEHWPTVTLTKGLHTGTNTVDIVANGANGQHIERRLVVQVGGGGVSAGTAQVSCDDNAPPQPQQVQQGWDGSTALPDQAPAAVAGDAPPPDDTPPPVAYDAAPPPVVYDDQYYYDQPDVVYDYPPPVYVYTPYPVIDLGWVPFVPFFGFGFFYSHYHPWCPPPYYGGGWNGGWGGGWHGGGGGWSGGQGGNPPPGGWNGGGWRNGANPPRWNGNGSGSGWRNGANPPRWNGGAGGASPGWQGAPAAPRPAPQPYRGGSGQYRGYNGPVQVIRGAPSAPPQYRPAPAAPQSYGGGGYRGGGGWGGGGFHGGGGGSFHGGGGAGFHGGGGGGFHGGGGHHR